MLQDGGRQVLTELVQILQLGTCVHIQAPNIHKGKCDGNLLKKTLPRQDQDQGWGKQYIDTMHKTSIQFIFQIHAASSHKYCASRGHPHKGLHRMSRTRADDEISIMTRCRRHTTMNWP